MLFVVVICVTVIVMFVAVFDVMCLVICVIVGVMFVVMFDDMYGVIVVGVFVMLAGICWWYLCC